VYTHTQHGPGGSSGVGVSLLDSRRDFLSLQALKEAAALGGQGLRLRSSSSCRDKKKNVCASVLGTHCWTLCAGLQGAWLAARRMQGGLVGGKSAPGSHSRCARQLRHAPRPRCSVRTTVRTCEGYQGRPTHTEDYHKGDEVNCAVVSIRAVGQQRCVLGASEPPR
jgi:hypothetical protein